LNASPNRLGPDLASLKIDERARSSGGAGRFFRILAALLGVAVLATGIVLTVRGRPVVVEAAVAKAPAEKTGTALLNASGYVTPRRRATIAAKITGRVEALYVEEGMRVGEGQVLAKLDESDAHTRLVSAQADRDATAASIADLEVNAANAERELKRAEGLAQSGVSSAQALDTARTTRESLRARIALAHEQVRAAEARIAMAKQDIENTTVRAPFAGIVVSKDAQVGEMVSPISAGGGFTRTGIATIVDMNSLEIEVDVNESYIARVRTGQAVTATLDAYPDWQMPAKVRTVIPTADRQKATVKVRISFVKLDPRILPDMGVKVAFLAEEKSGEAPRARALIPQASVRQENGVTVVYVVREGRIQRRAVTLGAKQGEDVEVLAGVSQGDQIVVRGPESLREGQAVEIKKS
jgi:RND family efflux transporter MFP subunit